MISDMNDNRKVREIKKRNNHSQKALKLYLTASIRHTFCVILTRLKEHRRFVKTKYDE
jgi:hypothetical protein